MDTARPQEPVKPYPYEAEEVQFANSGAGITLAGTLTLPPGKGKFPVVILIAGGGSNNRDEEIFQHRPFLVIADALTRRGVAVLRYDCRGIGQSTGDFGKATTADLATDVEAAIAYLRTRKEINAHRMGLIEHGEGAILAPMVAARRGDVRFIVLLAGQGLRGKEVQLQRQQLMAQAGDSLGQDSMRHRPADYLAYDPDSALEQVRCPVLAMAGAKDLEVAPEDNLVAIGRALEKGGNRHFEVKEFPGLNHYFQECTTGLLPEVASIKETFSPVALGYLTDWAWKQAK
ncbi:hypothetical protein GCM10011511_12000 [Puia dinghuensis]|uniref:Peptidase S9 prolyl oligopeptidase catalytic domain-containing protein n=2 Tax=Puia dinghuensis TaxID=1792502 RepID=A0A8J2UAD3_9BACT|nr:hypothetical protein GCM10011511_12000 [Puia dinghuensis]